MRRPSVSVVVPLSLLLLLSAAIWRAVVEDSRPFEAVLVSPTDGSVVAVIAPVFQIHREWDGPPSFVDEGGRPVVLGESWAVRSSSGQRRCQK